MTIRNKHILISILLIFALQLSCSLPFTKTNEEEGCTINVGVVTSLSGGQESGGNELLRGIEMAEEDINQAGGVIGCNLNIIVKDDNSVQEKAQIAVKELVEQDNVPVIIGSYTSAATTAAAGVANAYSVPLIVPSASSDLITEMGYKWVFRINASSADYADAALAFTQANASSNQIETIGVLYVDAFYGESAAVVLASSAQDYGLKIVAYESYISGQSHYNDQLERIQESDPDVLFVAANVVSDAKKILQQMEDMQINPKMIIGLAGAFVNPDFLSRENNSEYSFATAQWSVDVNWVDASEQTAQEFTARFFSKYGLLPGMRSVQAYTTVYVIKDAIERADQAETLDFDEIRIVRQHIRDALNNTQIEKSLFGNIRFDDSGQNAHPVLIVQIIEGNFVTVYPDEFKAQEAIIPAPLWSDR